MMHDVGPSKRLTKVISFCGLAIVWSGKINFYSVLIRTLNKLEG
jgi:hypothetical protein